MKYRILSVILKLMLLTGFIMTPCVTNASTNGYTRQQAVDWALSQVGKYIDADGAYGYQCVDVAKSYYSYLGQKPVLGNGKDYATNTLPSGWDRIEYYNGFVPEPGDVAIWTDTRSGNGHVAIITSGDSSNIKIMEQNWPTGNSCSTRTCATSGIWGVIRPDFPPDYVDLGDEFYALILQRQTWIPITNDDDEVARLHTETGDSNQLWQFIRQDDGSYVILSAADGEALELYNGITDDGNPVKVHNDYWGGNYQRWYIYRQDNGYVIMSAHYKDYELVLDLRYDNKSDGAEVITYRRNNADVQIWGIYKVDDEDLRPKNVRINVGNSVSKTTFYWDDASSESSYAVKIHKISQDTNELYHVEWGATSGYGIQLPPGDYYAYVASVTQLYNKGSENIYFTVEESGHVDLGANFYALILQRQTWIPITNDDDEVARLHTETGESNQLWQFIRQDDGSYVILSAADGEALELYNGITDDGNPVKVHNDYWGGNYQRWYIYRQDNGYVIMSAHYKDYELVLDLRYDNKSDGAEVITYRRNNADVQIWGIYKVDDEDLIPKNVRINVGNSASKTTFYWDDASSESSYAVKIHKISQDTNELYHVEWGATSGYGIQLPPGDYVAYVTSVTELYNKDSTDIRFSVRDAVFNVIFNTNGGMSSTTSKSVTYNSTYGILPVPERDGYVFRGWYTSAINGTLITDNSKVLIVADQTLYAQWEKVIPYTETQVIKSGTKLIVDTKLYDFIAPYDILIGGYNGDKIVAVKRVSSNEQNFPYMLEGDMDKIKVMVWSDLSTLKPLCEAEEITSDKFIVE